MSKTLSSHVFQIFLFPLVPKHELRNGDFVSAARLHSSACPVVAILSVCWLCNHRERGEGGGGGGSWIHRYTHLPLSTSFFLLFLPYSPSYTANLCISHACRLQISSHWGKISYLLFIDSTVHARDCLQTHKHTHTRTCLNFRSIASSVRSAELEIWECMYDPIFHCFAVMLSLMAPFVYKRVYTTQKGLFYDPSLKFLHFEFWIIGFNLF